MQSLFFIPFLPLMGFVLWLVWLSRGSQQGRTPLTGRLLRPPGYSLALQVEVLQRQFMERLALASLLAAMSAGLASQLRPRSWGLAVLLAATLVEMCLLLNLRGILFKLRSHARGLLGEQAVGETLSALRADGCHVFHDLVQKNGELSFNIDHIVVGPQGVFAIETKYRRKRPAKGRTDHEVEAHAHTLQFPTYLDRESIPQAERHAQWLASFLKGATAEAVKVQPILALPGWFIHLSERNGVPVLNEKGIVKFVRQSPSVLSDGQIKRIVHQLDQRCRNVEV